MHFKHKIVLIMDFLEECCFLFDIFSFFPKWPIYRKMKKKCQKTTLLQKCYNQYNFVLKMHLRGTFRHSMFYFFDFWLDFLKELLSFRTFHQILAKKCIFSRILAIFDRFSSIDPHFQAFRFLQPYEMYTFSESPGCKLSFKL